MFSVGLVSKRIFILMFTGKISNILCCQTRENFHVLSLTLTKSPRVNSSFVLKLDKIELIMIRCCLDFLYEEQRGKERLKKLFSSCAQFKLSPRLEATTSTSLVINTV